MLTEATPGNLSEGMYQFLLTQCPIQPLNMQGVTFHCRPQYRSSNNIIVDKSNLPISAPNLRKLIDRLPSLAEKLSKKILFNTMCYFQRNFRKKKSH